MFVYEKKLEYPIRITRFDVISRGPVVIRCHYCNHAVSGAEAKIL